MDGDQTEVKSVTVHGREYLVFPLVAAREMVLDYPERNSSELLPRRHLQQSVSLWEGTPLVYIHPENERRTADDPREYTETIIGMAYQPEIADKDKLRVMAYIDVEKARDIGGLAETVVNKLKQGEALGVSAGYATLDDDRSGGTFNGTQYDVEQGYIVPDHIAIFPNDEFQARCDWEDGCGAPRVNMVEKQNVLSEARRPTYDGITSQEWDAPSFTEYAEEWYSRRESDPPDNMEVQNVAQDCREWIARRTLIGDPDADTADELVSFPVVELNGELNENALTAARNLAFNSDAQESIMSVTADLLENAPPNSGEWDSGTSYNFNRENHTGHQRTFGDHQLDRFDTEQAARERAAELGCDGYHEHPDDDGDGEPTYMPCDSHAEYSVALSEQRQNRLTACEVEDTHNVERETAEHVRTLINEYEAAESRADFKQRIESRDVDDDAEQVYTLLAEAVPSGDERTPDISTGDMVEYQALPDVWGRVVHIPAGKGTAMVDLFGEGNYTQEIGLADLVQMDREPTPNENIPSATEQYTLTRTGEYVTWDTGSERQHGQVTEVTDNGCLSADGTERCVDADSGDRLVKIQLYSTDGEPRDAERMKLVRRDGVNEGNLRSWNAPRSARMNGLSFNEVTAEVGDRTVDLTPPDSVQNAAELALEKKDELDKGDCGTGVGEQRASQIVNENLAPEDFLSNANGTAIPTYLDSHEEDAAGLDKPPSEWSDEEWDGIVSDGDSPRCGPIQYALWGGLSTGTGLNWAEGVRDELADAMEATENTIDAITVNYVRDDGENGDITMQLNLRSGQYVQWDWSGGTAYGKVEEIVEDGTRTVEGNERSVSSDDDRNIAVIEQFSEDGEPQNQRVIKYVRPGDDPNENDLRGWEAGSQKANIGDDPATLFSRFLSSIGVQQENTEFELPDDAVVQDEPSDDGLDAIEAQRAAEEDTAATNSDPEPADVAGDEGESGDEQTVTNTDTDADADTDTDDGDTSVDTQTMIENQMDELSIDQVAAKTAFGISELEEMDDQMLRAIEQSVIELSDDPMTDMAEAEAAGTEEAAGYGGGHGGGGEKEEQMATVNDNEDGMTANNNDGTDSGSDADAQNANSDQFLTVDEAEERFATSEDMNEVTNTLEEISSTVENIANEQGDSMDEEAAIVANAIDGMDKEAAKSLPDEKLTELAEKHAPKANFGAVPGQTRRVQQNAQTEEDVEDYPAGGRTNWKQRKAEGGD